MLPTYRDAQLAARDAAGSLSETAVQNVLRELKEEAQRLAARIAALPVGSPAAERAALEASTKLIGQMQARLMAAGTKAVAEGRAVAFAEVAGIWQRAAVDTAAMKHIPNALMGAVRQPPITLLGAYEALGGGAAHWKTALHGAVQAAGADLDAVVRAGLAAQVSPETLAKGLRAYVVGAEPFHAAFPGEAFKKVQDLRVGIPKGLRESGRKLAYNARRIAYSEVHNARAEAELTHFALDPLVAMVRWTLSAFRGAVSVPDVCDILASADYFGLGPGMYPVGRTPPPPHPFDRCERMPVTRSPADAAAPKPYPLRLLSPSHVRVPKVFRSRITAAQEARVLKQAEAVMNATEVWATSNPLQAVVMTGLEQGGTKIASSVAAHRAALAATKASAAAAPLAPPVALPAVPLAAPAPLAPVKVGTFLVPGELAAVPGKLDEIKALIKKNHSGNTKALGQLEAMGIDATEYKAGKAAFAAKKAAKLEAAAAAEAKGAVVAELDALKPLGVAPNLDGHVWDAALVAKLKVVRELAETALEKADDGLASVLQNALATNFPGSGTIGFSEKLFAKLTTKIDLLDEGAVAHLLEQAPSPRVGKHLAMAAKKAKNVEAGKIGAATKQAKKAAEVKLAHGIEFAPGTPVASMTKAAKLVKNVDDLKAAGKLGHAHMATASALKKLPKLGVTADSLAGLEATWTAQAAAKVAQKAVTAALVDPALAGAKAATKSLSLDPAVVLGKKIGEQAGTNPGGLYLGKDGVKRYVKFYADAQQGHGEALANQLYRDLGMLAPKSGVGTTAEGKFFFASELLEDVVGTVGSTGLKGNAGAIDAIDILDGFAADVLTANWDAVGTGLDNVVRLKTGAIARIDQGGAFLFRAQGGLKSKVAGYGKAGLNQITEFDTLYTENAFYRQVFDAAGLTPQTMGNKLTVSVNAITELEASSGGWAAYVETMAPAMGAAEKKAIAEMLTSRANLLRARAAELSQVGDALPVLPLPAPQAAKAAIPKAAPVPKVPPAPTPAAATSKQQWASAPYIVDEPAALSLQKTSELNQPFYFQSGKTSLAKIEAGIDVAAAPAELGVQGFSLTASPGAAKHGTAVVSQFAVNPAYPLYVDVTGAQTATSAQKYLQKLIDEVLEEMDDLPDSAADLSPAQMTALLQDAGYDAVVFVDAGKAQQVIVLDPSIVKLVKTKKPVAFTAKATPWAPVDQTAAKAAAAQAKQAAAAAKAAEEKARLDALSKLPVEPRDLEVPGLPSPPVRITNRGKATIGLEDPGEAQHLLSDRERRMHALADAEIKTLPTYKAIGGTAKKVQAELAAAMKGRGYGSAPQRRMHELTSELAHAIGKREGLTLGEIKATERVVLDFINNWSGNADSRGAEVLKLLAERLRPGNIRTAKAGGGFFDHDERAYRVFVQRARSYLETHLPPGMTIEKFSAGYDALVSAQRAVLRMAHPGGTIRVNRGVSSDFFTKQGVTRGQFGSSAVVAHNSLSSFSTGRGFGGVTFSADVAIGDVEFHFALLPNRSYWGEAEVWLVGRPRLMSIGR